MYGDVPILVKNMNHGRGRLFWVSRRNKALAAATYGGGRFTIRELAERVGMSVMGVHHALRQMARLGIGVLKTVRGRLGYTSFRVQKDVSVGNVRTTESGLEVVEPLSNTVVRTFSPEDTPRALRWRLGSGAC